MKKITIKKFTKIQKKSNLNNVISKIPSSFQILNQILINMQKRTKRPRKIKASSIIFPGRIMISSYCEKDFCASTALHKQGIRSDWKSDLLGSEPQTSRHYSNTGIKKEIAPRNSSNFLKLEHLYVLPTQLGRCQSLDIRWMVCFLKTKKGKVTFLLQNATSSCYKQI